jgi:hypothetical protein
VRDSKAPRMQTPFNRLRSKLNLAVVTLTVRSCGCSKQVRRAQRPHKGPRPSTSTAAFSSVLVTTLEAAAEAVVQRGATGYGAQHASRIHLDDAARHRRTRRDRHRHDRLGVAQDLLADAASRSAEARAWQTGMSPGTRWPARSAARPAVRGRLATFNLDSFRRGHQTRFADGSARSEQALRGFDTSYLAMGKAQHDSVVFAIRPLRRAAVRRIDRLQERDIDRGNAFTRTRAEVP